MQSSLNTRDYSKSEREPLDHSNLRGLLTLLICSAIIIAVAYGAMLALTSPDGWVAQAVHTSFQLEDTHAAATAANPLD